MTKQILESSKQERFRIAVLDDYQHVALSLADWSVLEARAGFVTEDLYRTFYGDAAAAIAAWIEKQAPSP